VQDGDIISGAQSSRGAGAREEIRNIRTFLKLVSLDPVTLRRELLRRRLSLLLTTYYLLLTTYYLLLTTYYLLLTTYYLTTYY
jgi:hypothetical protein